MRESPRSVNRSQVKLSDLLNVDFKENEVYPNISESLGGSLVTAKGLKVSPDTSYLKVKCLL